MLLPKGAVRRWSTSVDRSLMFGKALFPGLVLHLRSLCRVPMRGWLCRAMGAVRQWLTKVDRDPEIGRAVRRFRHLARLRFLSVRYAMDIAVGLNTVSRSLYAPGML